MLPQIALGQYCKCSEYSAKECTAVTASGSSNLSKCKVKDTTCVDLTCADGVAKREDCEKISGCYWGGDATTKCAAKPTDCTKAVFDAVPSVDECKYIGCDKVGAGKDCAEDPADPVTQTTCATNTPFDTACDGSYASKTS
jgi:hypothetical protein